MWNPRLETACNSHVCLFICGKMYRCSRARFGEGKIGWSKRPDEEPSFQLECNLGNLPNPSSVVINMNNQTRVLTGFLLLTGVLLPSSSAMVVTPPRIRPPNIIVVPLQAKERPLELRKVAIHADIAGGFAQTEIELSFYNPNNRVLEGSLDFPLQDGQSVTGFALNFGDYWREAVPVEKAKGQQIFEDTIRTKVDPALLEQTQGNNYKLRIYPIPAQNYRKVRLTISEKLASSGANNIYRLPLIYPDLAKLLIDIQIDNQNAATLKGIKGLEDLKLTSKDKNTQSIQLERSNLDALGDIEISLPDTAKAQSFFQNLGGQTYFMTQIAKPMVKAQPRAVKSMELLWDSSLSGLQRKTDKELELLKFYFQQNPNMQVRLQRFSNVLDKPIIFNIQAGDWSKLRAELERTVYDGGTNFNFLDCESKGKCILSSERLLFTDGLDNMTLDRLNKSSVPLYVIASSIQNDPAKLKYMTKGTGGALIVLAGNTVQNAARLLNNPVIALENLRSTGAKRLVVQEDQDHWYVAGIRTAPSVQLQYRILGAEQTLEPVLDNSSELVAGLWAAWSVQDLQGEADLNQGEIRRLGNAFKLVTPETSLIVLDTAQDYLRYDLQPPADLKAEFEQLFKTQNALEQRQKQDHVSVVRQMLERYEAWWKTDFPKGAMQGMEKDKKDTSSNGVAADQMARPTTAQPPASPMVASESSRASSADSPAAKMAGGAAPSDGDTGSSSVVSIQLKKWTSDAPYIARMQKAKKQDLYRIYLDERPSYLQSTAFFLDVADYLFDQGQTDLGLRVLSNLSELELENRAVLRILAYRYLQAKRPDLAVHIFEQVQKLAPTEPQSYRDLGLAYAQAGRKQLALETLYKVVERTWDGRFPEVELIVLNEINALIASSSLPLRTDFMDQSLIKKLPLDIRVVLTWDADNTDMDLWITDPNGERVFYGHNLSYQGGRISRDFTGGYGPEEFSLKLAKPGKYRIETNYYGNRQQLLAGAVTLQAKLISHFATKKQQDQLITLRLKDAKETVVVGEFEVK